jgi:hypothetical protein
MNRCFKCGKPTPEFCELLLRGEVVYDKECLAMNDDLPPQGMTQSEAERAIAAILAQLETETGQLVTSIDIVSLDATRVHDERRRLQRSVRLTLEFTPGSNWSV